MSHIWLKDACYTCGAHCNRAHRNRAHRNKPQPTKEYGRTYYIEVKNLTGCIIKYF